MNPEILKLPVTRKILFEKYNFDISIDEFLYSIIEGSEKRKGKWEIIREFDFYTKNEKLVFSVYSPETDKNVKVVYFYYIQNICGEAFNSYNEKIANKLKSYLEFDDGIKTLISATYYTPSYLEEEFFGKKQ